MRAIDLFAGPGGWDLAAAQLGLRPLGIEWDESAYATRTAAGLDTIQADVSLLDPAAYAPRELLIASPPCPTFSNAGSGDGHLLMDIILDCVRAMLRGEDTREESRAAAWRVLVNAAGDEQRKLAAAERNATMSMLVIEPLRWALALEPDFIALEQVPSVLDIWKVYARALEERGYSTWAGLLSSEQYGVPQTRTRAIMLASKKGLAHPPRPTHQSYVPGEPAAEQHTLEGVLEAWVSMADALGWHEGIRVQHRRSGDRLEEEWSADRPSDTITSRVNRWQLNTGRDWKPGGTREDAQSIGADQPAPTITGGDTQLQWRLNPGKTDTQPHRRERPLDEPAPTIAFGHDSANWRWEPEDVVGFPRLADTPSNRAGDDVIEIDGVDYRERDLRAASEPAFALTEKTRSWRRWTVRTGMNSMSISRNPQDMVPYERDIDAPAPTLDTKANRWKVAPEGEHVDPPMKWKGDPLELKGDDWPDRRPATTIAGDARVFQPGGHHEEGQQSANAIVVEPHEAAVLQSFPVDYPWQGSRTSIFQQIGNAIPPLLAYHILKELLDV